MKLDLLAIGAHPDDIELTCGGTLIKLSKRRYTIGAVDLTRGELGTKGNPELRLKEAEEAGRILGLSHRENLGFPDGGIEINRETRMKMIELIRRLRPEFILLPYYEGRHFDHIRASLLTAEASFQAGLVKIETGTDPHRPRRLIYYMAHYEFVPSFIVDVTDEFEKKMEAVRAYRSQFGGEHPLFPLSDIEIKSRYYGSLIGAGYGEPFFVREALEVDDPIAFFSRVKPGGRYNFPPKDGL
jgi:bacillithiol biosynthesis deacetylase BshB1